MSPRETPVNLEKDADFRDSAALGAAVGAENAPIDDNLAHLAEAASCHPNRHPGDARRG